MTEDVGRVSVNLSERMLEDIAIAERFLRLCKGWGHSPGALRGERIAGFYYQNAVAREAEAYPAHAMGAIRDLVFEMYRLTRASPSATGTPDGKGGGGG